MIFVVFCCDTNCLLISFLRFVFFISQTRIQTDIVTMMDVSYVFTFFFVVVSYLIMLNIQDELSEQFKQIFIVYLRDVNIIDLNIFISYRWQTNKKINKHSKWMRLWIFTSIHRSWFFFYLFKQMTKNS